MTTDQRIARINTICNTYELYFEVLVNKQRKILLGGSFDSIYYYQFFILFTGAEKSDFFKMLEPQAWKIRFFSLENTRNLPESDLTGTRWHFFNEPDPAPVLQHTGLYFYAPDQPLYTLMGWTDGDPTRRLMDVTEVIDRCFALEDHFPR